MFYDNFIKACNLRGKTPSAALSEAGIDKSAATRWKNGKKPTDATLRKLADYFGVSTADLIGEPSKENSYIHMATGSGKSYSISCLLEHILDSLSDESLEVAMRFDQSDEKSRAMVRLALGLDDDTAIAARFEPGHRKGSRKGKRAVLTHTRKTHIKNPLPLSVLFMLYKHSYKSIFHCFQALFYCLQIFVEPHQ